MIPVRLFLDPVSIDDDDVESLMTEYYDWCLENVGRPGEKWRGNGVTAYSYRILFNHEADVIMFRLRFGL